MSIRRYDLMILLVMIVVLSACAPNTPAEIPQTGGVNQLVESLKGAGAQVNLGETQEDSFFSVPGRQIQVNGQNVTVFEFADEAAQKAAAATISGGGFIIGTTAVDWIDTPHFWAKDRLIALYVGKDQALIDLISKQMGEVVNAQAPSGGMNPTEQAAYGTAAIYALAQKLGTTVDQVSFVSAEAVEWTDSCLGLGGPAESCLQALTPGYRVTLNVQGTDYEVRTDETGSVVRIKE
ncbi:MAG: hypothetical protein EHM21_14990 [Chloroflexi bacterium]|nr:MAG: hypothetical protein EHM21_14990 [Chloroflexota bacterium]